MSTAVMTPRLEFGSVADGALKRSAQSWFVVAVLGQFIFAFTVASFYGLNVLRGNIQAWNKVLFQGFQTGDAVGNAALLGHILFATIISTAGALQLIPRLRSRFPVFHRWNGRLFVLAAFVMGCSGLYLTFGPGRKAPGDTPQHIASIMGASFILTFAVIALRTAMARDFPAHRRWALRLFIAANGSWFIRIGLFGTILLHGGPFGFDEATFTGPLLTFWAFASYLLPLSALELYLHAQGNPGTLRRMGTAAVLFVLTLATAAGVFAVSTAIWVPTVKAAYDTRVSIAETLSKTIDTAGIDQAIKQYRDLKASSVSKTYNFDESELNNLGYKLLRASKYKDAIQIFQLNIEAYPNSANPYDSLGEGYMDDGNKALAILNYERSLQLNPKNHNAVLMLQKLGTR
jgi:outer membrane protein assembly factor BamD (BamD/ComL family)